MFLMSLGSQNGGVDLGFIHAVIVVVKRAIFPIIVFPICILHMSHTSCCLVA